MYKKYVKVPDAQRKNCYDSMEEYYVVIKETGHREEEQSQEEIHRKSSKVHLALNVHVLEKFHYRHDQ